MISSHKELVVWQKSMDLAVEIYRVVKRFPPEEKYELGSQMRRAAVSIPSNIAEGRVGMTVKKYLNGLFVARGSEAELETQLLLANRLGYLSDEDIAESLGLCEEIAKMLNVLISKLNKDNMPSDC